MRSRGIWAGAFVLATAVVAFLIWPKLPVVPTPEPDSRPSSATPVAEPPASRTEVTSQGSGQESALPDTKRTIEGRVLDPDGAPLPGVSVVLQSRLATVVTPFGGTRHEEFGRTATTATGRFTIAENPRSAGTPLRLAVDGHEGFEEYASDAIEWGMLDVVIRLRLGAVLEVRTVDETTGEPVDPCHASLGLAIPTEPKRMAMPKRGRRSVIVGRPGPGVLLLAPVPAGEALLLIVPKDERHARLAHRVQLDATSRQTVTVRVPREQHRELRVLDSAGKPLAGATFQLVRSEVPAWYPSSQSIVDAEFQGHGQIGRVRMQGGTTDANGTSTLYGARGVRYELVLDPPGRIFHEILVDDAYAPLVIALELGAEIHGRVGPAEALARMARPTPGDVGSTIRAPACWLTRVGSTTPLPTQIAVAEDGSFRASGLEPGSYVLRMYWYDAQANAHHEELATVADLRVGEQRELHPELDHLRTTRLVGNVLWEGEPYRNQKVELRGARTTGKGLVEPLGSVTATTDATGRFTSELVAGTWRVALPGLVSVNPNLHWLESAGVTVKVGTPAGATFALHRTRLVLRVLDADGTPAADRRIQLRFERSRWFFTVRTDATGLTEFDAAPGGACTSFELKGDVPVRELGSFVVPEDRATHEVELRLPH